MPRSPNEPPPLNPNPYFGGGQREHIDNTNLNNKDNPAGFTAIARAADQKTGADDSSGNGSGNNAPTGPTVTVQGDATGSAMVYGETELADALVKAGVNPNDFTFTRASGAEVSLNSLVKGDMTITAHKKQTEQEPQHKESAPPESGQQSSGA